jgi:hypothetical protein
VKKMQADLQMGELHRAVAKATALIGLYATRANSVSRSRADAEQSGHEMKVIKAELLTALMHSKKIIQGMQKGFE